MHFRDQIPLILSVVEGRGLGGWAMKIIPLSEGAFTIDTTKKFIPFDTTKDDLQQRTKGSLLLEIQPFAIITSKDIIVIDTGLGFSNPDGTLQIHQNLLNNGIGVMEVTKVLLSHLHKDHSGGIAREDKILQKSFTSFPHNNCITNTMNSCVSR